MDRAPYVNEFPKARFTLSGDLVLDKVIDFFLIFIGLYAAIAVQRYQDERKERTEYVVLLEDFVVEIKANRQQHATIERDLGPVIEIPPGPVLGPMAATFEAFEKEMSEDEQLVKCLHREFAPAQKKSSPLCHKLYAEFEKNGASRAGTAAAAHFEPVVLSPFYRYEVWELYTSTGAKLFKNKDLAVKIGEIYNNARLIEKQVAEIEGTYNDTFMKQVGRMLASEASLAEIVHDEETDGSLSAEDVARLGRVGETMRDARFATLEAKSLLEAKIRRMKKTVLTTNGEIDAVLSLLDTELRKPRK